MSNRFPSDAGRLITERTGLMGRSVNHLLGPLVQQRLGSSAVEGVSDFQWSLLVDF